MKTLVSVFGLCLAVVSGAAYAQDMVPVPDQHFSPVVVEEGTFVESCAEPLFTNVKYKDLDEMSPCAQPKIIAVKNPCLSKSGCNTCEPQCVYIQICVPTCGCELISCKRQGDRIRYDYGEYAVSVRVKKGYIEVDYQD
jgi:hypothetical protein